MKKIVTLALIVLVVALGLFFYFQKNKPKSEYSLAEVSRGNLAQTVSATGTLNPETQVDLGFKAVGRLKEILVSLGDRVSKKQKVAMIEVGTLWSDLRAAEYGIQVQKRTLANMKRRRSTYKKEEEDAQRAVIKKYVEEKNAILDQLRDTNLYSPIEGEIIKKNFEAGETAAANSAVLTVAKGDLIVESDIPESDIVKIKVGQKAQIYFDSLTQEEKFESEIYEIEPAATVIQDVIYYKIKARLAKPDPRLKPGMTANLDIETAGKNNVLIIPLRAVKMQDGRKMVDVLRGKNTVETVEITTGLEGDEGMVEVISGLNPGDKVITFVKNGK